MEIDKTLRLPAPPQRVWALLLDPQAMAGCVPGMQSVEVVGPDEYTALMQVKMAFISARFTLRTRIVEKREPHYLRTEGTGEDTAVASSLKQTSEMHLDPQPDGSTALRLRVQVDVVGRIASFGLSAMKTKADRLWDEFGVNLAGRLGEEAGAAPLAQCAALDAPPIEAGDVSAGSTAAVDADAQTATLAAAVSPASQPQALPVHLPPEPPRSLWQRLLAPWRTPAPAIVIEVRRPDKTIWRIEWPAERAAECGRWLDQRLS